MTPNILFIFSDQHRRASMGFWQKKEYSNAMLGVSDPVHTPNLDRLADSGIVLSEAYSSYPVCSPFRAMLFSGLYPENNGVWQNCAPGRKDELRGDITTLTDVLADSGYSVGYIGKWHLEEPRADFDADGNYIGDRPDYKGKRYFPDGSDDSNTACWDTLIRSERCRKIDYLYAYNTHDVFRNDPKKSRLSSPHYWDKNYKRHLPPEGMWSPDFETDLAINFLNNQNGERKGDKPYALFVSYNPPHSPYSHRDDTDHEAYDRLYSPEKPRRQNVERDDSRFLENTRIYYSHVTGIDRCVGRLLSALDGIGAADNTIVVFTSDHGEMLGSHGLMAKNVPFEEATAIPFVIRYPDKLSHRTDNLLITGADIMPTLLGLAGIAAPNELEGSDYSNILRTGEGDRPISALFTQPKRKGIRTHRYLLTISFGDDKSYSAPTLFDLESDPYQMNNLPFSAIPEEELLTLRTELGTRLALSDDPWFKKRLYPDFIIYPTKKPEKGVKNTEGNEE
ncbi:MAG: sulfatase [Clostridia bacterium]|nr:sulfatase [Clostridia bacterium]